jgi:phospholipid/cholesterol/gamma-HCH transport system substrate-binding protein
METRANYIIIGLFTIFGFLGLLGFLVWFSQSELDRQFAYYETRFDNVSGLNRASSVRFAGLEVGQVLDIRLSEVNDGTVTVRLEIAADTPIRTGSIATIESQGVTGVSFISISAGTPSEPLLREASDADTPEIPSGLSFFQTLTEDAPEVLSQTLDLIADINTLFGPENRDRFQNILVNLDNSSEQLNSTLEQFSTVANTIGSSVQDIASFTGGLGDIAASVESTLAVADTALSAIDDLSTRARVTLDAGTATFDSATRTLDTTERFIDGELRTALVDFTDTSTVLRERATGVSDRADALLESWRDTGITATARLTQAENLLNEADDLIDDLTTTLAGIDTTTAAITGFVEVDARAAAAQVTEVLGKLDAALATDVPAILADIRAATETANVTIASVGQDITSAAGRLDTVLAGAETTFGTVADTFTRANATLATIDAAMITGERTLAAAEGTFVGADKFINEELVGLGAQLESAVAGFNATLDTISADVPEVTANLRATTEEAQAAFASLSRIVAQSEVPIGEFLNTGLPQFTRFAAEGRELLNALERLTNRIERDPTRFFLGRTAPEFTR